MTRTPRLATELSQEVLAKYIKTAEQAIQMFTLHKERLQMSYYRSARGQRVTLARCWRELKIHGHDDRQSHTEFLNECWQPLATIEEGDQGERKIEAQELLNWLGY